MKKLFTKEAYNYALYGALFGLCFPVVATVIESIQNFGTLSFQNIWLSQSQSPLLWIIDTAPFVLSFFSFFIGQKIDLVHKKNEEILKTQEQLILQEKLASIGQMIAGIAHEIKNPLNFVTNYAESSIEMMEDIDEMIKARKAYFDKEDYAYLLELLNDLNQNFEDIKSNGKRANRIVLNLMDQTRDTKGKHKQVDIHQLLDENIKLAYHSYRANHSSFNMDIQKSYDQSSGKVMVNPHSLGRVFLNIFNNAAYAMDLKQQANPNFYPALLVKTRFWADKMEIRIRDNGIGIPDDIKQKIFNPFFTTKPIGQGNTGLGLSISRDIVMQEHKGDLVIESQRGDFTEFIIRLPYYETIPVVQA